MRLSRAATLAGFRLDHRAMIASTNDIALAQARAGDPGRLWVVADEQSGGRGRLGRAWRSPPGNLYASVLLIDPCPPARAAELGFVAGCALGAALGPALREAGHASLKWPNDLLIDGAKCAGLLLEAARLPDGRLACVAGFGVNCASHPAELPYRATNLAAARARPCDPASVFEALADELIAALALWRVDGFAAIRAAWLARAHAPGAPLRVTQGGVTREGRFKTIDARGRLVLQTNENDIFIDAGDVLSPAS